MDILSKIFLTILFASLTQGCAKSFKSEIQKPLELPRETTVEQPVLAGNFKLADGTVNNFAGNTRPIIIFFVSETCLSCREETEKLAQLFLSSGLPTKVQVYSILIGSFPEDVESWKESFGSLKIDWIVGVDEDLKLFFDYFQQIKTPSILYFNADNKTMKRWQSLLTIDELVKETGPWY